VTCYSRWFSHGTPVASTNKTDRHDIAEILLKVALSTITLTPSPNILFFNMLDIVCLYNSTNQMLPRWTTTDLFPLGSSTIWTNKRLWNWYLLFLC